MTNLGMLIKRQRLKLNMSQNKLVELSGISRMTISRIELCKQHAKLGTALKLMKVLGIKARELKEREGE